MEKGNLNSRLSGLGIIVLIALFASYLSSVHASFDALVVAVITGMMVGNLLGKREHFSRGIEDGVRVMLPVGIALYGTQLSISSISYSIFFGIVAVFVLLFGLTILLSKVFRLRRNLSILLASGLSICGASAIAVISPLIGAKREETSISILSVMMLGLIGMIFYPLLSDFLYLTTDEFNFISGTTLPMLGQVNVAASNVCPECIGEAVQIKLVRVTFLLVLTPLIAFRYGGASATARIPWFIFVFIFMSVLVNIFPQLLRYQASAKALSTFFFSGGLAAVGFSVDFGDIIDEGVTPFILIMSVWAVVLLAIYMMRSIF